MSKPTNTPLYVYLLDVDCYESRYIKGVFATPEAAMAEWQPEPGAARGSEYGERAGQPWSYEWSGPDKDGSYHFGADWSDAASITRYEVEV